MKNKLLKRLLVFLCIFTLCAVTVPGMMIFADKSNTLKKTVMNLKGNKTADAIIIDETNDEAQQAKVGVMSKTVKRNKKDIYNQIPEKPLDFKYELDNIKDGMAAGLITVKVAPDQVFKKDVVMYWADDNGKLSEYRALAKFKVEDEITTFKMPQGMIIPPNATALYVYTQDALNESISDSYFKFDLPKDSAFKDPGKPLFQCSIVSDAHLTSGKNHIHNRHFENFINDSKNIIENNAATIVVGDMINSGAESEYQAIVDAYKAHPDMPPMYWAIGNHDLYNGTMEEQTALFLKYAVLPDGSHPKSTHYDFWLNGYHFIFIGDDQLEGCCFTTLEPDTLKWIDETIAEDYDPSRPAFIFLHQSMYNTIAGSLPGQGFNGVKDEENLAAILAKYPEAIMFNGHSHWTMDSESNMCPKTDKLPTIFNTASIGYLWHSYNIVTGEELEGAEGYVMDVYKDKILVKGRDYVKEKWIPSAQYVVDYSETEKPKEEIVNIGKIKYNKTNITNVSVRLDFDGRRCYEVYCGNNQLTENVDYIIKDDNIVLMGSFLNTLETGMHNLKITFKEQNGEISLKKTAVQLDIFESEYIEGDSPFTGVENERSLLIKGLLLMGIICIAVSAIAVIIFINKKKNNI